MMNRYRLACFTDATATIGLGHLSRMMSLGETFLDHPFPFQIITLSPKPSIPDAWLQLPFQWCFPDAQYDEPHFIGWLNLQCQSGFPKVAFYDHPTRYHHMIHFLRENGVKTVCVDDNGTDVPQGDLIINQNLHTQPAWYQAHGYTSDQTLLGTRYLMLKKSIRSYNFRERTKPDLKKILITMGGSDPANSTAFILDAFVTKPIDAPFEFRVLTGHGNSNAASLVSTYQNTFPYPIRFNTHTNEIEEEYQWADLVITAGGTTCYELLYSGTPFVVIPTTEIQLPFATALQKANSTFVLDPLATCSHAKIIDFFRSLHKTPNRLLQYIQPGKDLVDGLGTERIKAKLMDWIVE